MENMWHNITYYFIFVLLYKRKKYNKHIFQCKKKKVPGATKSWRVSGLKGKGFCSLKRKHKHILTRGFSTQSAPISSKHSDKIQRKKKETIYQNIGALEDLRNLQIFNMTRNRPENMIL